jgi:hypothetical protein
MARKLLVNATRSFMNVGDENPVKKRINKIRRHVAADMRHNCKK